MRAQTKPRPPPAPPREHVERRALITFAAPPDKKGVLLPAEARKRGTIVDEVLGYTDDGYVVHIPTGRFIGPPEDGFGNPRCEVVNDRKFVLHMLDADPEAWESSRAYEFGAYISPYLRDRLKLVRDTYPGD